MEQNQEGTSEPLKPANHFETADRNVDIESPPPQDKNDILYIVSIAIGIGFALPFYRFVCRFGLNELICDKIIVRIVN